MRYDWVMMMSFFFPPRMDTSIILNTESGERTTVFHGLHETPADRKSHVNPALRPEHSPRCPPRGTPASQRDRGATYFQGTLIPVFSRPLSCRACEQAGTSCRLMQGWFLSETPSGYGQCKNSKRRYLCMPATYEAMV